MKLPPITTRWFAAANQRGRCSLAARSAAIWPGPDTMVKVSPMVARAA